jgi:hypothetical protein
MISPRRISARNVVGGLVAASILGAGVALAIEHSGGPPLNTTVGLVPAATSTATPTPKPGGGEHVGGMGGLGGYGLGAGQILGVVTKDTGQTPMQIVTSIAAGKTLRDIAGSDATAKKIHDDALATITTALDTAVSKGAITADQETTLKNAASSAIDVLLVAHLDKLGLGQPGSGLPFGGGHAPKAPKPSESPEPSESAEPTPSPTPTA